MFSDLIWPENVPKYIFIYLVASCKISASFDVWFERYTQSYKTGQQIF
jgi:hypothetical protein